MRVRLSQYWRNHKPGDVIDLNENEVQQLDRAGYLNRGKDGKPLVVAQRAKAAKKASKKAAEPAPTPAASDATPST